MKYPDVVLYLVHGLYWASFGVVRLIAQRQPDAGSVGSAERVAPAPSDAAEASVAAPYSRTLLVFHSIAFGVMYLGIGNAVFGAGVPNVFPGQRVAGGLLIALGAVMNGWALLYFRSWRLRAKVDAGHQLATGGPFAVVRHPIYLGLDLLAIGSAVWVPTAILWAGAVLMVIGSDLRGRAEERLLLATFGEEYRAYRVRTRRFVPGVY